MIAILHLPCFILTKGECRATGLPFGRLLNRHQAPLMGLVLWPDTKDELYPHEVPGSRLVQPKLLSLHALRSYNPAQSDFSTTPKRCVDIRLLCGEIFGANNNEASSSSCKALSRSSGGAFSLRNISAEMTGNAVLTVFKGASLLI